MPSLGGKEGGSFSPVITTDGLTEPTARAAWHKSQESLYFAALPHSTPLTHLQGDHVSLIYRFGEVVFKSSVGWEADTSQLPCMK